LIIKIIFPTSGGGGVSGNTRYEVLNSEYHYQGSIVLIVLSWL